MLKPILAAFIGAAFLFSCDNGTSKPNYKFLKAPTEGVAAKVGKVEITNDELNKGIESDLYDLEKKIFETKMNKLKSLIIEKLMAQDPAKKGLTNDEYMDKHIAKNVKVSESDITNFVKEKNIPKEQVNAQIKERIRGYLIAEKKKEAVESWLGKKTKGAGIEVYLDKPRRPSFDVEIGKAPTMGPENAPVTIVEFSDFQCPYCSKAAETVEQVKKEYGNKVRIVFKQYPLPFHSQAKLAANAALCAWEQKPENFWKMHDKFFADQSKLGRADLIASAKSVGVNEGEFTKCLDGGKFMSMVEKDIQQGKDLGVKSTPTFFVNGKLLQGAQPFEMFKELIDEELSNK
ncbi:MAG: DsbA family protein [Bacteriovoracaceae bacterium]|nr:DsbA family protein [Bacteriovoracaceae bacterium]